MAHYTIGRKIIVVKKAWSNNRGSDNQVLGIGIGSREPLTKSVKIRFNNFINRNK